jgi:hypothetical protein
MVQRNLCADSRARWIAEQTDDAGAPWGQIVKVRSSKGFKGAAAGADVAGPTPTAGPRDSGQSPSCQVSDPSGPRTILSPSHT